MNLKITCLCFGTFLPLANFAQSAKQVSEGSPSSFECRNFEGKVSMKGKSIINDVQAQRGFKAGILQAVVVDDKTAVMDDKSLFIYAYDKKDPDNTWLLETLKTDAGSYIGTIEVSHLETMHREAVICISGK